MKITVSTILLTLGSYYVNAQTDSLVTKIDSLDKVYHLKEVTITSHKRIFTQKPDRLIFNVENSIIGNGGNALDALRITPGIKVQNEQIILLGNTKSIQKLLLQTISYCLIWRHSMTRNMMVIPIYSMSMALLGWTRLEQKIMIDLDYLKNNNNDSISDYGASYLPDRKQIKDSYYANIGNNKGLVSNYSAKVDVDLPLRWVKLNCGGQLDFTINSNDYMSYANIPGNQIADKSQRNYFKYKENIAALYLSVGKNLNEKFSIQRWA